MNPADLRWTMAAFLPLPCAPCVYLQTPRGPVLLHPSRFPPACLEILCIDSFALAAEGTAPFLIFLRAHPLPIAPPRAAIMLSVSGAVCLQAPESLICLGSQL